LEKLFLRPRTYIGFGAFLFLEAALVTVFYTTDGFRNAIQRLITLEGEAGLFGTYFSCYSIATLTMALSVFLLGGIYLSLVAGDIVAKESEDGTLRMILSRPASRFRILVIKYVSCLIYTVVLALFIGVTAWLMGVILRGWGGGLAVWIPERGIRNLITPSEAPWRFFLSIGFLGATLCTMSSIAFFFSCWRIKPAAATILAVSYVFVDMILRTSQLIPDYEYLLITNHMSVWAEAFEDRIPWEELVYSLSILWGINASLFTGGWMVFQSRDFKS
jgi:ABC-2 type transport system permease protein